ncbi:hypothetical protein TNCV_469201 [Trichonephila clavipes]|nr:hypothetical protein TNCV_469201 [Trichonephila clavipes]
MLREKSDIGCKDLVPVPQICLSISIKHMRVCIPICPPPDYLCHRGLFETARELISTLRFSPDEKFRVTIQTKWDSITEENSPQSFSV